MMPFRISIAARLAASWSLALLMLAGISLIFGKVWEGLWLTKMLALGSLPLLALAVIVSFVFARSVSSHPYLWTIAAVVAALIVATSIAGRVGLLSLVISIPAAIVFLTLRRIWPPPGVQADIRSPI
jgi:hypothetical protein